MGAHHVDAVDTSLNRAHRHHHHPNRNCRGAHQAVAAAPLPAPIRPFKLNPCANEFIPASLRASSSSIKSQAHRMRRERCPKPQSSGSNPSAAPCDVGSGPQGALHKKSSGSRRQNLEVRSRNSLLQARSSPQRLLLDAPEQQPSAQPCPASPGASSTSLSLAELPSEVLACILSKLESPSDAASFSAASRLLHGVSRTAPLSLVLSKGPGPLAQPLEHDGPRSAAILRGICASFSGTQHLDLQGCAVSDTDVAPLLSLLPRLDSLQLSGCKKLSPDAAAAILSGGNTASRLRTLAMQRCFQLTAGVMDDVLRFTAGGGGLRSVVLSHLTLAGWPSRAPLEPPLCSGLQVLALNNCSKITEDGLQALRTACPQLEQLFLGGSTFLTSETPSGAALADLSTSLPHLRLLEVTFFPPSILRNLREATSGAVLLDFCHPDFESALSRALSSSSSASAPPSEDAWGSSSASTSPSSSLLPPSCCPALSGAVNCSNAVRQSPLHVAADLGNGNALALLRLGASLDARDRSGATPLFVACFHGHADVASALLEAGADPMRPNSAGETPLYISCLRGHLRVTTVLLSRLRLDGVLWEDGRAYADGWTPLMAATVGDHFAVALELLAAAGPLASTLVGAANRYGQTALHLVARRGSMPLLQAMLRAGGLSAVGVADNSGFTAADIAGRHGHSELKRAILQAWYS